MCSSDLQTPNPKPLSTLIIYKLALFYYLAMLTTRIFRSIPEYQNKEPRIHSTNSTGTLKTSLMDAQNDRENEGAIFKAECCIPYKNTSVLVAGISQHGYMVSINTLSGKSTSHYHGVSGGTIYLILREHIWPSCTQI